MRARALRAHVYRDEMTMKTPAARAVLHTPFRGVEMGWSHAMKKPQKGVCTPARAVFIHVFGFGSRGGRVRGLLRQECSRTENLYTKIRCPSASSTGPLLPVAAVHTRDSNPVPKSVCVGGCDS